MKKILSLLLLVILFASCVGNTGSANVEMKRTEANQERLSKVQPAPMLEWSLERENLTKRLQLWNDPNKVSYIHLFSYGRLVGFYTIKGKVSSVNSMLTNTEQILVHNFEHMGNNISKHVVPSPDFDGSYGSNGSAIFFFLTSGAYMEWNGEYLLVDQPMRVEVEPLIMANE